MPRSAARRPRVVHVHRKMFLPTYGVFDEDRFPLARAGISVCFRRRSEPPRSYFVKMPGIRHATIAALKGARLIIIPSAFAGGVGLSAGSGMLGEASNGGARR